MKTVTLTDEEVERIISYLKSDINTYRGRKGYYSKDYVFGRNLSGRETKEREERYNQALEDEKETLLFLEKFKN